MQRGPKASILAASTLQDSGAPIVVDHGGGISLPWSQVQNASDYWLALGSLGPCLRMRAIETLCLLGCYITVAYVARHFRGWAAARISIPSSGCRHQASDVALGKP
jgi:hypothetical protein